MKNDLAGRIAEVCVEELAAQQVEWDAARLVVSYLDETLESPGILTVLLRSEGKLGGVDVDPSIWADLAELKAVLSQEAGGAVMRLRVAIDHPGSEPVVDFFLNSAPDGSIDWVWPDEPGYAGRVYLTLPVDRLDSWEFDSVSGSVGEPSVSLGRIQGWLEREAPEFAAMLNPAASPDVIAGFEERFGVVLPRSLREAWSVHDGQSGDRGVLRYLWLSLADAAEEFVWFADRPDGGMGMIPVLRIDGHIGYVESVESLDGDGPLWLWEVRGNRDLRLADSFGEYLAWFADASELDEIVVIRGLLNRRDEI